MARSMALRLALVALICAAVAMPLAQAITCGEVASKLASCVNYLRNGGTVPPGCCSGISSLNAEATTTPDRQAVCNCLKTLVGQYPGVKAGLASGLPGKCGVRVPYPISTSTDCQKVK